MPRNYSRKKCIKIPEHLKFFKKEEKGVTLSSILIFAPQNYPLSPRTTHPEAFGIYMQEKWSIIVCWSGNATKNEHPVGRQIVLSRFSTRRHDHFTTELLYIGNGSVLSRPGPQESAGGNAALGLPCTWHFCALVSLWKA